MPLPIAVPNRTLEPKDLGSLVAEFHHSYERIYGPGTSLLEAGVEINTFRLEGRIPAFTARTEDAEREPLARGGRPDATPIGVRDVVFSGKPVPTSVYMGEELPSGVTVPGPAIAEFAGTTVVIGPGQKAVADNDGHLVISPAEN